MVLRCLFNGIGVVHHLSHFFVNAGLLHSDNYWRKMNYINGSSLQTSPKTNEMNEQMPIVLKFPLKTIEICTSLFPITQQTTTIDTSPSFENSNNPPLFLFTNSKIM